MDANRDKEVSTTECISSIDGFFNRKRGRPPKNRFVKVYKNQETQAIFTSFKIDVHRNETKKVQHQHERKQSRPDNDLQNVEPVVDQHTSAKTFNERRRDLIFNMDSFASRNQKEKSVVRSSGIYFPADLQGAEKRSPESSETLGACCSHKIEGHAMDMPEDLRLKKSCNKPIVQDYLEGPQVKQNASTTAANTIQFFIQLKEIFEFYQKQHRDSIEMEEFSAQKFRQAIIDPVNPLRVKANDEFSSFGYLKFRHNEDCGLRNCPHRYHQSHFHCKRSDCFYSFCDKNRFVQHTARHKRLDSLMGSDFKQYRSSFHCSIPNCINNSHFHCLKCDFVCNETNKVLAHRRKHNKLDYVQSIGFERVTSSEQCSGISEENAQKCSFSGKQTHYHCLLCGESILTRSQLEAHQRKHHI